MKILIISMGWVLGFHAWAYQTKKVEFFSQGSKLVGTLYLPGEVKNKQLPGVVVTGAWTTVKEQMPKTYAIELAKKGYGALTFDFRGWGQSEGKNRYLEDPQMKTQDILAAIDFLGSRSEIDSKNISGLGICASSGYMADAYNQTKKLKTIALVAPWLHNKKIATKVYGGEDSVKKLLSLAESASKKFKKSGLPTLITAASSTDKNSLMFKAPYYTEKNRGLIAEYDNKFNVASWTGWLNYDALKSAKKLRGKILFIGSNAMALPQGAKAYSKIAGNKVKEVWLDKISQFDFYDKKDAVQAAIGHASQHFQTVVK